MFLLYSRQASPAPNITGDTSTGTMWVFTESNYPGMATQLTNVPGNISAIKTSHRGPWPSRTPPSALSGLIGSANQGSHLPPGLDAYSGIAWWQDRRNSDVGYNEAYALGIGVLLGRTSTAQVTTARCIYCATNGDLRGS